MARWRDQLGRLSRVVPEHLRIPIRRADAQMQVRAERQQPVRDLHGLDDQPVAELIRALAAQNLLDSGTVEGGAPRAAAAADARE
jgi:hypothetical protein